MPPTPPSQTSATFETVISGEPGDEAAPAAEAVDHVADDEHERVHPEDVGADHREHVALVVAAPDGDVAGEVHHARHHREARDDREHRGRDARAA